MIEQTTDLALIRSYLDLPEIIGTFNGGARLTDEEIETGLILHCPGVGLFPCRTRGTVASIHAAIPKNNRGQNAVIAGKMAVSWLKDRGFRVICRVDPQRLEVRLFCRLVGFNALCHNGDYRIYEA